MELLQDFKATGRPHAAEALERMGAEAAGATDTLIKCLGDDDPLVTHAAADACVIARPHALRPPLLHGNRGAQGNSPHMWQPAQCMSGNTADLVAINDTARTRASGNAPTPPPSFLQPYHRRLAAARTQPRRP